MPPKWYDFVVFFFSNYFAHAVTVVNVPGQHWHETVEVVLVALLWPVSGMSRALPTFYNHAALEQDVIKRAARAGALCMVVRKTYQRDRDVEDDRREWWDTDEKYVFRSGLESSGMSVHGRYKLREGYTLCLVPARAAVSAPTRGDGVSCCILPSSYNIPKLLVSFVQALWAAVTLYRARGDQIEQFGYAAFGLTVAQYAFMSVINIIGNLLQPDYPSLFMIRTPLMNEAEGAGCYFEGEINVQIGSGESTRKMYQDEDSSVGSHMMLGILLGSSLLVLIARLSFFKKQDSTSLERGFTMSWLVFSIAWGPCIRLISIFTATGERGDRIFFLLIAIILFGAPAIGGMVMVGRMIQRFGICTLLE